MEPSCGESAIGGQHVEHQQAQQVVLGWPLGARGSVVTNGACPIGDGPLTATGPRGGSFDHLNQGTTSTQSSRAEANQLQRLS